MRETIFKVILKYNSGTTITFFSKESEIAAGVAINPPADDIETFSTGRLSYK